MEDTKIKQIFSQGKNPWKKVEMVMKYKVLVPEEHHNDDIYKGTEPWEFKVVEEEGKARKALREKKSIELYNRKKVF